MRLVFDGELRWVCPHCGAEATTVESINRVKHRIKLDLLLTSKCLYISDGGIPLYVLGCEDRCPNCGQAVSHEDIRRGFNRWLTQLRRRKPKRYAKILSEVLESASRSFWR
jgi:predicted RNA-binding Zn-ribbon protein involved in translation (DUF1610 family)